MKIKLIQKKGTCTLRTFIDLINTLYILGFHEAKRNIFSRKEKDKCCNQAVLSAICGRFATEREDSQNIYIILAGFHVSC
jgi:hypothetical protein